MTGHQNTKNVTPKTEYGKENVPLLGWFLNIETKDYKHL